MKIVRNIAKLNIRIKTIRSGDIEITEMAIEMISSQMAIQFVSIQITNITIFTQRMATVRCIIWITFAPMHSQLFAGIGSPFE